MAKTIQINIDASGAVQGSKQATGALKNVSAETKGAQKSVKDLGKAKKDMAKTSGAAMQDVTNAFNMMGMPLGRYMAGLQTVRKVTQTATATTKALRISLIALPFVAIATAVLALFKAFSACAEVKVTPFT